MLQSETAPAAPDPDEHHAVEMAPDAAALITSATQHRKELLEGLKPFSKNHESAVQKLREHLSLAHLPRIDDVHSRLTANEKLSLQAPSAHGGLTSLRVMSSKEYQLFNKNFWAQAFARELHSLEDLAPLRIRVVYRIVRHMAEIRGLCHPDEMLSVALMPSDKRGDAAAHLDPFDTPTAPTEMDLYKHLGPMYEKLLHTLFFMPKDDLVWFKNLSPVTSKDTPIIQKLGLPLHPPPVPLRFLQFDEDTNSLGINPSYVPEEDLALNLFMDEVRMIIDYLQIGHGTFHNPNAGYLGLQGILNYDLLRIAWPTKTELLAYEFIMVEDVMNKIVSKGIRAAREYTEHEYGCNPYELDGLMRMARDMAKRITEQSLEDDRAIATLRMERYIERAVDALDLKAEMNANKHLAMITGLTRAEHDNEMKDMLDVVKKISAKSARKATEKVLANNAQKVLASAPVK